MTPSHALHQSIRWMMLDAMMAATWRPSSFDIRAGLFTFRGHGRGWTFYAVVHPEWQFGHARKHELLVELEDYEALLGAINAGTSIRRSGASGGRGSVRLASRRRSRRAHDSSSLGPLAMRPPAS